MDTNFKSRREFLGAGVAMASIASCFPTIDKALAVEAFSQSKSIKDVKHLVILMQENRSFDHYFGAMRGVRGFGDRFPIPLESGRSVWFQSNGKRTVTPFHINSETMNAALIASTPHAFRDQQGAWNQGKLDRWPEYKSDLSMGYYKRAEIPFQWALADSFTICDHHFCSIRGATDPNRVFFWSGSNVDPARRAKGLNSDMATAETVNLRCWVTGEMPDPGYTYYGSALPWKCIPEVLEEAGVSWRIYQDPNDNWEGAMHGGLAFKGFREARPGSALYENGLRAWSLDDLREHSINGTLPSVSWVLPSRLQSEHPDGPSSPARGGYFTQQILEALVANPDTWSKTALFITFDENDGLFDHLPSPAVPSYNRDGTLAGKSTLDISGMYFETDGRPYHDQLYERLYGKSPKNTYTLIDQRDTISGNVRPWGMGARVPMYVVSPWTRGGWVNSQVFDHTSVAQFIEKRFQVTIPAISPWARAVSGDLTSVFDFATPNDRAVPALPDMTGFEAIEAVSRQKPDATAPGAERPLFQEHGVRPSRAISYELHTSSDVDKSNKTLSLVFKNTGAIGAVFHAYDRMRLDKIPRRYTVEAGCELRDLWPEFGSPGFYDVSVYGPNGFFRSFKGHILSNTPEVRVVYDVRMERLEIIVRAPIDREADVQIRDIGYRLGGPWNFKVKAGQAIRKSISLRSTGRWYDFSVTAEDTGDFERRFAGRMENGEHSYSDPLMGT